MFKRFGSLSLAVTLLAMMATPVLAMTTTATTTVDVACVAKAVDARETSLISAVDAYHTAVVTALTTRQTALKNAWTLTDRTARRQSIRTAWQTYTTSIRQARLNLSTARRTAWQTFAKSSKACHATADDTTTSSVDANL